MTLRLQLQVSGRGSGVMTDEMTRVMTPPNDTSLAIELSRGSQHAACGSYEDSCVSDKCTSLHTCHHITLTTVIAL
jgi:hypothetical protein